MRFDPSGLSAAFDKMSRNARAQGKDLGVKQGWFFLRAIKRMSWQIAPTEETLDAVYKRLGWRMKRKKGWTPERELARRKRSIGTFARKWRIAKTDAERYRVRIWLVDLAAHSEKVDNQKGISDAAEKKTGMDFKRKLNRMAERITGNF